MVYNASMFVYIKASQASDKFSGYNQLEYYLSKNGVPQPDCRRKKKSILVFSRVCWGLKNKMENKLIPSLPKKMFSISSLLFLQKKPQQLVLLWLLSLYCGLKWAKNDHILPGSIHRISSTHASYQNETLLAEKSVPIFKTQQCITLGLTKLLDTGSSSLTPYQMGKK